MPGFSSILRHKARRSTQLFIPRATSPGVPGRHAALSGKGHKKKRSGQRCSRLQISGHLQPDACLGKHEGLDNSPSPRRCWRPFDPSRNRMVTLQDSNGRRPAGFKRYFTSTCMQKAHRAAARDLLAPRCPHTQQRISYLSPPTPPFRDKSFSGKPHPPPPPPLPTHVCNIRAGRGRRWGSCRPLLP